MQRIFWRILFGKASNQMQQSILPDFSKYKDTRFSPNNSFLLFYRELFWKLCKWSIHLLFPQNILVAMFGSIFYLSVGIKLLSTNFGKLLNFPKWLDEEKALASLCIITAIVFLIDTVGSIVKWRQNQKCALCLK